MGKIKINKDGKIIVKLGKNETKDYIEDIVERVKDMASYKGLKLTGGLSINTLKVNDKLLKKIHFENCYFCKEEIGKNFSVMSQPITKKKEIAFIGLCKKCAVKFKKFIEYMKDTDGELEMEYLTKEVKEEEDDERED